MILILGLFSSVFAAIYHYDRKQRFSGWLAIAYASGLAAFLVDVNRSLFDTALVDMIAKAFFWGFSIALVAGVFSRHEAKVPSALIWVVVGLGSIALFWFGWIEPNIVWRSISSSITAGVILTIALPLLWQKRKGVLHHTFFVLFALLCATYFLRPLIVYGLLGAIHTPESYGSSIYAALLYGSSVLCGLTCGVTMIIMAGSDIIRKHQLASTIDPLTGIMNRRGLEKFVLTKIDTSDTTNNTTNTSIIMVDLDRFKGINDDFGHDVGDQVLKRTASIISTITSQLGIVARIGGEEFAIVLNVSDEADSIVVAQHLRLSLAAIEYAEIGCNRKVTGSFGVAMIGNGESFRAATHRADLALYQAKAAGRNCVREAQPSTTNGLIKPITHTADLTAGNVRELSDNCIPFPKRNAG